MVGSGPDKHQREYDDQDRHGGKLAFEIGQSAFANGSRDLLHSRRADFRTVHLLDEVIRIIKAADSNQDVGDERESFEEVVIRVGHEAEWTPIVSGGSGGRTAAHPEQADDHEGHHHPERPLESSPAWIHGTIPRYA